MNKPKLLCYPRVLEVVYSINQLTTSRRPWMTPRLREGGRGYRGWAPRGERGDVTGKLKLNNRGVIVTLTTKGATHPFSKLLLKPKPTLLGFSLYKPMTSYSKTKLLGFKKIKEKCQYSISYTAKQRIRCLT